jgi:hypothetical protein
LQAGSLFGKGTIDGALINGAAMSTATITPGDSLKATGTLTDKGTYTQDSTGVLDISIETPTQYDQLNPTTANLSGTLNINLPTGAGQIAVGDKFKIMNFTSKTGTFSTVNGLAINSTEHFTITYEATDVLLTVVSGALAPASSLAQFSGAGTVGPTYGAPQPGWLGFGRYGTGSLNNFPRYDPRFSAMAAFAAPMIGQPFFGSQLRSALTGTLRTRSMVDFSGRSISRSGSLRVSPGASLGFGVVHAIDESWSGLGLYGARSLNNFARPSSRLSAMAVFTPRMVERPIFSSQAQSGAPIGTIHTRSMVDFSGQSISRSGRLQTSPGAFLGFGVISAAKLASMGSVIRQSALIRIAAFGPARNFSASTMPHGFVSVGATSAVRYRSNPSGALLRNNGHTRKMMPPRSLEYHLDVLSLLGTSRRQALRGLLGQPGNPSAASFGYLTFSGVR